MRLLIPSLILFTNIVLAAPFADPTLPFLFSTVDARDFGNTPAKDNLTVRGLCLKLDDGYSVCYDTDLLRVSLIWRDGFLTEKGVAGLSYADNKKAGAGQKDLPKPIGKPILAHALVPGWLPADTKIEDTRERSHDPKELGLGPMDPEIARYRGLIDTETGRQLSISFDLFGASWSERMSADAQGIRRHLNGNKLPRSAKLVLATFADATVKIHASGAVVKRAGEPDLHFDQFAGGPLHSPTKGVFRWEQDRFLTLHLAPSEDVMDLIISIGIGDRYAPNRVRVPEEPKLGRRWPEPITNALQQIDHAQGYVIESLGLPEPNPWRRRVRVSGVAADPRGGLYVVTFDGDVWHVTIEAAVVTWNRIAGGLNEPQSIQVVGNTPCVYTRTGIIKIFVHEPIGVLYDCLSNLPAQTAETREFPMDMVLDRGGGLGGGFYLAKGGQNATGKLNGTIVHVRHDGLMMRRIATGLRQPYLGIHPQTGLLTASDQQGHYVPATPIHRIREGKFYGYKESGHGQEDHRLEEPATWIPHVVTPSASGQVWALDERFGPLNGRLLQLDFNKAQLSQVFMDPNDGYTAAVHRLPFVFPAPLLKACIHPEDGALYLGGFNIWGSTAKQTSGLFRMRYTGDESSDWPVEVRAYREGLLLQFAQPLAEEMTELSRYRIKIWNYLRSSKYGSGYYKMDGSIGQDDRWASAVRLSLNRSSVFIVVPKLHPVDQLELNYRITTAKGHAVEDQVYMTLKGLRPVPDALRKVFGFQQADFMKAAPVPSEIDGPIDAGSDLGETLYLSMGCIACHSIDGTTFGKTGPSWKGLPGSQRTLVDGSRVTATDAYLRESIYEPGAHKVIGFEATDTGMPSYQGILNETQVESIIRYMKTLDEADQ
jgi:mono/diheme cytochrome c family protein